MAYQGRKASNTTSSLFIADNSGQMVVMSTPQDVSDHYLFEIEKAFKEMIDQLESAGRGICARREMETNIKTNPKNAKQNNQTAHYFDEELYQRRTAIERANAWKDGFKALIIRYEKTISS